LPFSHSSDNNSVMNPEKEVLENLVYRTISGSRSYGLETNTSDEDTLGVFVPRPEQSLGVLDEDSVVKHFRSEETDANYKTLTDFVKFARDGSSFWVEPLFVREQEVLNTHPVFEPFLEHKKMFLTKALISKSLGFMEGMCKRSRTQKGVSGSESMTLDEQEEALLKLMRKQMSHAVRVGHMIMEMLDTFDLRVHRAEEKDYLLGIKHGLVPLEKAQEETDELIVKINERRTSINLPEKADAEFLSKLLVTSSLEYWKLKRWI